MFDAYTVKKVLPRLFIAIILIQLSWFIFTGVIKAVNLVAYGIEGLIYAPFGGLAELGLGDILAQAGGGAKGLGFASIAAATAGAVMAAVAVGGVFMTALIALIGVLIAFILLLFRQVIIVGLLIIAPLAVVAWILPSTEKYWKLWWDSFFKLLLVYPIILAMIAVGRVFASTIADIDPGAESAVPAATDIVTFLMIVACLIGPFFLIPKTFQMAGGAFAALSGALANRGAGAKNWAKKRRGAKVAENMHKLKTGDRFSGRNAFTRSFNRRSSGLMGGAKAGFGFGARGEAYHDLHGRAAAAEALQSDKNLQQLGYDDAGVGVMALSGGTRAGAEAAAARLVQAGVLDRDQADRAVATAAAVGFNNSNATAAMTLMAQNKSRILKDGRKYDKDGNYVSGEDLSGEAGMAMVRNSAGRVSGSNAQMQENLMGGFAFNSRNAGRMDLGGESAGVSPATGWQRGTVAQHSQSYGESMNHYARQFSHDVQHGDADERRAAAIALSEMQNMLPNSSAENQDHINDAMAAAGVDHDLTREVERRDEKGNVIMRQGKPLTDRVKVSVEEQLSNIANGLAVDAAPAPVATSLITSQQIAGEARQYGSGVPVDQRDPGQQQQQQPPPGQPNP